MKLKKIIGFMLLTLLVVPFGVQKMSGAYAISPAHGVQPYWYNGCYQETSYFQDGKCFVELSANDWTKSATIPNCKGVTDAKFISDSFNIEDGREINFSFSMDAVDPSGTLNYKSVNGNDIDIYCYNADTDAQICCMRIWFDAGGYLCGNHSVQVGSTSWPSRSITNWINGNATFDSKFDIFFSKENLFRSYCNNGSELKRIDTTDEWLKTECAASIANVKSVYFRIASDGGFTSTAKVRLNSINGFSFEGEFDGAKNEYFFTSTKGPELYQYKNLEEVIPVDEPYTFPFKFFSPLSNFTTDVKIDGVSQGSSMTFTPTEDKQYSVEITSADDYGNTTKKDFSIEAVSGLVKPEFEDVPEFEDARISYNSTLSYALPKVNDVTGNYTLKLFMELPNGVKEELSYNETQTLFIKTFNNSYVDGTYTLQFSATNAAGTTLSDPQEVIYTFYEPSKPDFVESINGLIIDYVPEGIRGRGYGDWRKMDFGVFNINYSIDIFITVPTINSDGKDSKVEYLDLQLQSVTGGNNWIMYRVWMDSLNTEIFAHTTAKDYGGTGGIGYTDGKVKAKGTDRGFHLHFDPNDYFGCENGGEIIPASAAKTRLDEVFNFINNPNFNLFVYAANNSYSGDVPEASYEFVVTVLNDQSFANDDGQLLYIAPEIYVSNIEYDQAVDKPFVVNAYCKIVTKKVTKVHMRLSKYDTATEQYIKVSQEEHDVGDITINPTSWGEYMIEIFVYKDAQSEATKEEYSTKTLYFMAKSNENNLAITLSAPYQKTYDKGAEVTVSAPTYTGNPNLETASITLIYNGQEREVEAGERLTLSRAGLYTLDYYVEDNAQPVANSKHFKYFLDVGDVEPPVINVGVEGSKRAEEMIILTVDIEDDTECDVFVTLIDLNGYKTIYQSRRIIFTPDEKGTYSYTVRAEDAYGNVSLKSGDIVITDKAPNQILINWIIILSCFGAIVVGLIGVTVYEKVKASKEKVK